MEANLILAVAALGGASIGGALSFLGSWLGQKREMRAEWLAQDRSRRRDLYKEFIEEASRCYVTALGRNEPDVPSLVNLYGKMSRMRALSSPEVIAGADRVLGRIVDTYREAAVSIDNQTLHALLEGGAFDILRKFSETCRAEFDSLRDGGI